MKVAGLMSGTSADGIDAALVDIDGVWPDISVRLVDYLCVPYDSSAKERIFECFRLESADTAKLCSLNFELGYAFAGAVRLLCERAGLALDSLDLIGSHGQTVYHIPPDKLRRQDVYPTPSTLQIGEPTVIAFETKTDVVSNFRSMDIAAGGQGAPLVPITEYILFKDRQCGLALQNIGGISNVTVLPMDCEVDDVFAFDTGPGNMIIDGAAHSFFEMPMDIGGRIAAQGHVNEDMLSYLMSIPFIKLPPPKTTGRELFGNQFVSSLRDKFPMVNAEDFIATVTMFTASAISENFKLFVFPRAEIGQVVISGGGAYNHTLLKFLQKLLPVPVMTSEDAGYSSEAKEAIAFALLAYLNVIGVPGNIPGATGADKRVVLGGLTRYMRLP